MSWLQMKLGGIFRFQFVLCNFRNVRILTQDCSRCKKNLDNSRQMLKFMANAKIHSFCDFRDFGIALRIICFTMCS